MSSWIVDTELAGQTLAAFLRDKLPGTSWSKARGLCERGKVSVGGVRQLDSSVRVAAGTEVVVKLDAPRLASAAGLEAERLLYLDEDVVVVDKPAGVLSVPFAAGERDTLIDRVLTAIGGRGRGGELGAVHRLDKDTSGVMLFTRTLEAKRRMQEQFRGHTVERRYLGIAHGKVADATHDTWLIEDRGDGLRGSFGVFRRPRGPRPAEARQAITHVKALAALRGATLVECRLETGRQHQIRIHLSEAGHPLVGEQVYIRDYAGEKIGAPRPMLHAQRLGFVHPRTGETKSFEAPPPRDFNEAQRRLGGTR
jgi:23S rRNA pseudouridine1911/1915/1917 synthase